MVNLYRPHYLKANRSRGKPVCHLFVDTETFLEKQPNGTTVHTLKMGWVCHWRRRTDKKSDTVSYKFFTTIDRFWRLVESHTELKKPLYMVIHNVSYDLGILDGFAQLHKRGWTTQSVYTRGHTSILSFTKRGRKIKILDNGNFFPRDLASLGEAVGFPKMHVDFETVSWKDLKAYCHRDVEIMLKAWQVYYAFLDDHDMGRWGHTLPAQAFNAFRHRFMDAKILMHGNPEVYEIERKAYKGGRCTAFWIGEDRSSKLYKLDVNSMYPAVMYGHDYPTVLLGMREHVCITKLREYLEKYCVVAKVILDTKEPVYPYLYQDRNVYPIGRFTTYLTTPEVKYALAHNHLKAVLKLVLYRKDAIFDRYVSYLYPLKVEYKKSRNDPFYHVVKLFLNGLYGRFGMRKHKWTKLKNLDLSLQSCVGYINATTGKRTKIYKWGEDFWSEEVIGETENSFPAVAAHVTAYARLKLWQMRLLAGKRNFLYCDTDGFIVTEQGQARLSHLFDPYNLGALKVEGTATNTRIDAPKYYRFGETWKRKGVPKSAVEVAPNTFRCDRFPSLRSQGHWKPNTAFHTQKLIKHFTLKINDGTVSPSGWVIPFDARALDTTPLFTLEEEHEIASMEWELDALRETRLLPHRIVFKVWNYQQGAFKRIRNYMGALVPLDKSGIDVTYKELGFDNLESFKEAVRTQVNQDAEIHRLEAALAQF